MYKRGNSRAFDESLKKKLKKNCCYVYMYSKIYVMRIWANSRAHHVHVYEFFFEALVRGGGGGPPFFFFCFFFVGGGGGGGGGGKPLYMYVLEYVYNVQVSKTPHNMYLYILIRFTSLSLSQLRAVAVCCSVL